MNSSFTDAALTCVFSWPINGTTIISSDCFLLSESKNDYDSFNNVTECYSELQIAPVLKEDESILGCCAQMVATENSDYIVGSNWTSLSQKTMIEGIDTFSYILLLLHTHVLSSDILTSVSVKLNFVGSLSVPCSQLVSKSVYI